MSTAFLASIGLSLVSSTSISLIRDTPYHGADAPWSLGSLWRKPRFRRYVIFFLAGFCVMSLGQDFVSPYPSEVHDQPFTALGIHSSLTTFGTAGLTLVLRRVTDSRGPRAAIGGLLVAMLTGCVLLPVGTGQVVRGFAALAIGSLEALRSLATGIVGPSFQGIPLAWGYAVFATAMGPLTSGLSSSRQQGNPVMYRHVC